VRKSLVFLISSLLLLPNPAAYGCTMFTATKDGKTLIGNNEDWVDPNTKMWIEPAAEGKYGVLYFGFGNMFPQGGMNDQGLVFDGFATPYLAIRNSSGKKRFEGNLINKVMQECATIDEVVRLCEPYSMEGLENAQLMFADRHGDSIIVEGDAFHRKKGDFQVVTNFYLSLLDDGDEIPCPRYRLATEMLTTGDVSVESFRSILAAVHAEGEWGGTQYSNIYDPGEGLIYLYHFHNFENEVVINLAEELAKGEHVVDVPSLFPDSNAAASYARLYNARNSDSYKSAPVIQFVLIGLLFFSALLLIIERSLMMRARRRRLTDVPASENMLSRFAKLAAGTTAIGGIILIVLALRDARTLERVINLGSYIPDSTAVAASWIFLSLTTLMVVLAILEWGRIGATLLERVLISAVAVGAVYFTITMQSFGILTLS
jgi:hypothetical protein